MGDLAQQIAAELGRNARWAQRGATAKSAIKLAAAAASGSLATRALANMARGKRGGKNTGRYLKRKLNNDMKQRLNLTAAAYVGASGAATVKEFTDIAQGDTEIQRTGDKILLNKIAFRTVLESDSATAGLYPWVRMAVVKVVTNSGGTSDNLTDIYDSLTFPIAYRQQQNTATMKNFKILFDRTIFFNDVTSSSTTASDVVKVIKWQKSFGKYAPLVQYTSGTTAVERNRYYLVMWCSAADTIQEYTEVKTNFTN